MTNLSQKADFTGTKNYVGMDVHLKSWAISLHYEKQQIRYFQQPPNTSALISTLRRDYPNASFFFAYEAGFCGFTTQRQLQHAGFSCIVVNAADVPQTDKGRKFKTDKMDASRLSAALEAGQLKGIYIPDEGKESHRRMIRLRQQFMKDQRRCQVRIKHFLHQEGVIIPDEFKKNTWSAKFLGWLNKIKFQDGASSYTLERLVAQFETMRKEITSVTNALRKLIDQEPYLADARLIRSVPGIGHITTATFLLEIADIGRFPTFEHFNSYIGFCPGEHSSGEMEQKGKITTRHHKILRTLMIEAAWVAVKKDPAMMLAFSELKKRMTAKRAIVRIARKLLNRVYHVWKTKTEYEQGIVE
jgi:transposase